MDSIDTNGIVPLASGEVALVSGGKANEPVKSLWERFCGWFSGGDSAPANPPRTITMAELAMLQTACFDAGGNSSITLSSSSGGSDMVLINASGERLDIVVTCTHP